MNINTRNPFLSGSDSASLFSHQTKGRPLKCGTTWIQSIRRRAAHTHRSSSRALCRPRAFANVSVSSRCHAWAAQPPVKWFLLSLLSRRGSRSREELDGERITCSSGHTAATFCPSHPWSSIPSTQRMKDTREPPREQPSTASG